MDIITTALKGHKKSAAAIGSRSELNKYFDFKSI